MTQQIDNTVFLDAIKKMIDLYSVTYIVVKTKYTTHHIEKLLASCKDRGTIKWIAETSGFDDDDVESQNSHVDRNDCFPRFYFLKTSFLHEFREWLLIRDLQITDVQAPKI